MECVLGASENLRELILPRVENEIQEYKEAVIQYNKKRLESYDQNMDDLKQKLEEVKSDIEVNEAAISFIKEQLDKARSVPSSIISQSQPKQTKLRNYENLTKELTKTLKCFQQYLGLSIKKLPNGGLRVCYEYIKKHIDETEHVLVVNIDQQTKNYRVESCTPHLAQMPDMLAQLNTTNDFARFVKDVRKAFVNLYA